MSVAVERADPAWSPPDEFEEYRVLRPLGRGAMGQVYLAEDRLLDRLVAVKFIAAESPSEAARQRFFAEARAVARLSHPNVVAVHRFGEVRRRPFLVSEYVRGTSLDRLDRPLPWGEALSIGVGLARGLAAAHRRGVLHRDIKPANAVLSHEGEVKLLDFGLAKLLPGLEGGAGPEGGAGAEGGARPEGGAAHRTIAAAEGGATGAPDEAATMSVRPGEPRAPRTGGAAPEDGGATASFAPGPAAASLAPPASSRGGGATASLASGPARAGGGLARTGGGLARTGGAPRPEGAPRPPESVVGTPLYMAPEVWRGEPASPRADVYALGVLLYELCAGRAPHHGVPFAELPRVVHETAPAPVAALAPGVDPRFAAVIDRCVDRDPARRFASGDELREALERLLARRVDAAVPEGNPYRGLLPFDAEHRGLFFGRDADARAVLDRLRAQPFVLVAGDSGAGKSSLCRAGVLPAVAEGALDAGAVASAAGLPDSGARPADRPGGAADRPDSGARPADGPGGGAWAVASARLGRRPLAALASALAGLPGLPSLADGGEPALVERLRAEPAALGRELSRRGARVLLFVDQLEELCTLADPAEAALAADALAALIGPGGAVRLLATARSDFLARLGALPGLGDDVPLALYLLRPLSPERLRDVITGPAAAKGFRFASDATVEALAREAARPQGGLALLQFTLAELWDARDEARREIPATALDALGGVSGALARHADAVLAALSPAQRDEARRLLVALVHPDGTRARRTDAELLGDGALAAAPGGGGGPPGARAAGRAALDALVRGRLLVAREAGAGEQSAYELAHEALVHGWDTLRGWLSGDAERRAVAHRLERAAAEWDRLGRAAEALWSARQLGEARAVDPAALGPREAAFLSASRRAALRRRLGRWAAALAIPLVAGLGVALARAEAARAVDRSVAAHAAAARAALDEARAAGAEAEALKQGASGRFGAGDAGGGEAAWQRALAAAAGADRAYARAAQELEAALRLGGDRADARALFGDALLERAALAERERRFAQRDELIARLAAHDDGGERRRRWGAPGRVAVVTSPPGAEVSLQRFAAEGGRRVLSAPRALGRAPLDDLEIEQGSILLTVTAAGRAEVRLPVVIARGERVRLDLALPLAGDVPEGFVHVPPGRFLYGMGEEGQLRGMLKAQPLHAAETGAYLIARHEVTFADWMEYLRALPPDERARRTPAAHKDWHVLELAQPAGGAFELLLKPTVEAYRAREGELLRYPGRARRAAQDWRRFPVSAISFDDATAYAAWLDRTARVPGARLCTELEWERAARGADDRVFPGGDVLEPDDANHDATYGRDPLGFGPDEVGAHPASASPFGVHDLAGNVFEWTVSADASREPVLRGGSWYENALTSVSSNREPSEPTLRDALVGARICATPRPHRD
ncbi:nSTAND1 domain-containing NTPase [Sorangium sp. So ce854]|uniref:nSTAND1 domain-containing NTPase n=1 Tax=Sorangium sp. So ce854 TaxID=3133322 RepID=UPI003F5E4269